jgi:hypothetical protein
MPIKNKSYVKIYTNVKHKYEGIVVQINETYVVIKDAIDKKERVIPFNSINNIEVEKDEEDEDRKNGKEFVQRRN